ncbi:MAG: B12-binding domain-containing protein [Desulfomonilaceae bacterium]
MLECTKEVLREKLPPEMSLVTDKFIDTASRSIERESEYISSFLTPDLPLHELAKKYLEALLAGKRHVASQLILEAVQNGTSIKDIYIYVFQQSQYEIGRLWYLNMVSVGQEHYCSAATQLIMSQLYPYIFSNEKNGRMFVAACVGGELHELGIRMVADLFEMDGWDTYYMGANTPTATVFDAVTSYKPDVLGISVSLPTHLGTLKNLISEIRNNDDMGKVKIIVGGYALRSSPGLWVKLGADGFAKDAVKAVELANSLVAA